MPASVLLLVLVSAALHATWNALLKRCDEPEDAIVGMMVAAAVVGDVLALVLGAPFPPLGAAVFCLVSGLFEAGYFVTLARALSRAPLGSVYTVVRGGALVVVWPVSVLVFGERITAVRLAGTVLVVLGLAATGASDRRVAPPTREAVSPEPVRKLRSGLFVAAICAVFVGGYHLAYKVALDRGGQPEAVAGLSLSIASAVNVAVVGKRRAAAWRAARAQPLQTLIGGTLGSVGFVVFLAAMKNAGAGVVLTLRNTSILFAQVLAFGLGERPKPLGIAGAALVTLGAVLLAS